jgi:hypothetical protein
VIRRGVFAALAILAAVVPAAAQATAAQTAQAPQSSTGTTFLSRFAFHVGLEHLSSTDPRFVWDAHWGGELDLVDYGRGAVTFAAVYQTILGDEFREFDPNQGNYTLEGAASVRTRPVEVALVFHHVSRHLSDRPKRFPVDWNMLGARVRTGLTRGRTEIQARVDVRSTVQKSFVDYRWEMDGDARTQIRLTPRVALVGLGGVRVLGVDGSRARGD